MILICSLIGKNNNFYFNKKIIFYKKKNITFVDFLKKNYSFCKKIYIILDSSFPNRKLNNKKFNIIYTNKGRNQADTIFKLKNEIAFDEKTLILNPDSIFWINKKLLSNLKRKKCSVLFSIKNKFHKRNFGNKDVYQINKFNEIISIKTKFNTNLAYNKKNLRISAGLYLFNTWENFINICQKSRLIKKKKIIFSNIINEQINNFKFTNLEISKFICLEDQKKIDEYQFWKKFFFMNKHSVDQSRSGNIQNIIPAAGEGSRHKPLGYNVPKPLIKISNKTMFEKSIEGLPNKKNLLIIFKKKTFIKYNLKKKLSKHNKFYLLSKKTDGMARTIYHAKKLIDMNSPIIVSSCDIKCVIDYKKFYNLIKKNKPDGMIFTWKNYPFASESPNSHAYVKVNSNNNVIKIVEKKPISKNPDKDHAVTGIFYFKNGQILIDCIEDMFKKKITVNGEYYVATAMAKLLSEKKIIKTFLVDQFISWSLPEHLSDYLYWENIFSEKN